MDRKAKNEALARAVELAGGQTQLAKELTALEIRENPYKQAHVWGWLYRKGSELPAEVVIPIEQIVDGKVSRHELRPDIYPEAVA